MQKLARLGYIFILLFLLILFIFNIFIIKTVNADPEKIMEIVTVDEINDEKNFSVSVLDPDLLNMEDIETPYLSDVLIEFNEMSYYIDENLEVTIVAPKVTQDEIFTIKASKEGYIPAYKNITILITQNNKLEIIHDDYVVDASKKFSVQIIDSEGNFVLGAEVYIQNSGEPSSITNERGYVTLKAPDNQENFVIIAKKDGYDYATQTFSVNVQPSFWESIIKNQYLPIFIGAILLIFAIIFVTLRQKRLINKRLKEKSDKENLSKYDLNPEVKISSHKNYEINENQYYSRDVVRSQQGKDAKVEEIRIARSSKEKEIIPVESNNIEAEKINNRRKLTKDENDWFKGTDDIRYEIDKLTGKIDENSVDKWFEGYDDIKNKIDEKLKKKDKSKDK